jgi:hypothetical protein
MRLKERSIPRTHILESTNEYEMIEAYPDDKYLPSYLVYSRHKSRIFHILFAVDVAGDHVRIVTAYYPAPQEWDKKLKKRR